MKKEFFILLLIFFITTSAYGMTENYREAVWSANDYEGNSQDQYKAGICLLAQYPIRTNATVVEIGCGLGYLAKYIATSLVPDGRVIAFDSNIKIIEYAQKKYAHIPNLEFRVMDKALLAGLEKESVNFIVSINYFNWIKELSVVKKMMRECARCLKPAGLFVARFPIKHSDCHPSYFFQAIDTVTSSEKWEHFYQGTVPLINKLDLGDYTSALSKAKFSLANSDILTSKGAAAKAVLQEGLLSVPTGQLIPPERRQEFFKDNFEVLERYSQLSADGRFDVTFNFLVISASKL